jgi:TonB family protein
MSRLWSDKKKSFFLFILFSLLFHLLLVLFLLLTAHLAKPVPPPNQAVFVDLNKSFDNIVDIPQPKKEEKSDKAHAQALYDQKVAEEKTAPATPAHQAKEPSSQNNPAKKQQPVKEKEHMAQEAPKPQPEKENLLLKKPDESNPQEPKHVRMPGMPEETASQDAPSIPPEYLHDYKIGDKTYINTLGKPNLRYFVELKRRFRETFDPRQAIRSNMGRIHQSRVDVVLGVSVNATGELSDLIIIRSSGIEAYDQEGKRTVKSSSPFSSPPAEFLTPDGQLHMAWTFIVYL